MMLLTSALSCASATMSTLRSHGIAVFPGMHWPEWLHRETSGGTR
jgi:hypothetical protein